MAKRAKSVGKKRKPMPDEALPYVIAFLLCEHVLVETDNVSSAIRIVDTITLPSDSPMEVGHGLVLPGLTIFVVTKAGEARGEREHVLRLVTPESPPVKHDALTWTFRYSDPPESGQNSRLAPLSVVWAGYGLYHFEVLVGGKVLARTPLLLKKAPATPAPSEPEQPQVL